MEIIKPKYFDSFKCIADRCPDTCCVGWEVEIDDEYAEQCKKEIGDLKSLFDKHLVKDADGYIFSLDNDRCPMLDERGLCRIQLEKGENEVCETCRLFPRYYDDYDCGVRETGLGLGCPEAARILLLPETEVQLNKTANTSDRFYNLLSKKREEFFNILNDENLDIKMKLSAVLFSAAELQEQIDNADYISEDRTAPFSKCIKVLEKMEYISEERREFLISLTDEKAKYNNFEKYSQDFIRLFKYYLMRYMMTACFDLDVLTKVKYGAFACVVIKRVYNSFPSLSFDNRVKIFYSFSKEVEYSPINIDILDDAMFDDFSVAELINLL